MFFVVVWLGRDVVPTTMMMMTCRVNARRRSRPGYTPDDFNLIAVILGACGCLLVDRTVA